MLKLDNNRKTLYQWDVGVIGTLTIDGVDEVHFSNLRYGVSFNIKVVDNKVEFPPEVLQSGADVFCWAFVREENGGYTKKEQIFNVEKRPRPADYVYEPTEILSWETLSKELENFKEDTTETLADLEKGTIKSVSDIKLWKLDTGYYYISGTCEVSTTEKVTYNKPHLYIVHKLFENQVRYIHLCAGSQVMNWAPIEVGYSSDNVVGHKEYMLMDTSRLVTEINKYCRDDQFPSAKSVFDYSEAKSNKLTEFTEVETDEQYYSAKATNEMFVAIGESIDGVFASKEYVNELIGGIENGSY